MVKVAEVMTAKVKTITSRSKIADAARAMAKWKIGALVIVEGGAPIGIITEGDVSRTVARGIDPEGAAVAVHRRRLVTVEPGEQVEVAARIMAEAGVKKLPVIEGGKLVGIITETDIVNTSFSLVTSLKEMVQARYRPPDFEM